MKCRCGKELAGNEIASYGNRCEDCWCEDNQYEMGSWLVITSAKGRAPCKRVKTIIAQQQYKRGHK